MGLHRRELLLVGAGVVAAKATASTLACAKDEAEAEAAGAGARKAPADTKAPAEPKTADAPGDHADHDAPAGESPRAAFAAAVAECSEQGEACLQHCIARLSKGDRSMAECARAVNDMLALCRSMGMLAHSDSPHLTAAVKVCMSLCTDCAAACRPHAEHHATCKACLDACERTLEQGATLLG